MWELNNLHRKLRKYRYFYYEKHDNLISDYKYDMLENHYDKLADYYNLDVNKRITNFVGFSIEIPMNIIYKNETN